VRSFRPPEAALAQSVEHRIRNAGVACSSHAGGTIPKARFAAAFLGFQIFANAMSDTSEAFRGHAVTARLHAEPK
jgi:hypothetical protein